MMTRNYKNRENTKYVGNYSKWQETGKLSCSKKPKPDKFFIGKLSQNYVVSLSHSSTAL